MQKLIYRNGTHLFNFVNEFNLVVSNTSFRKPQRKLWTFQYPDSTKAQIDFILVRRKWRNSIRNVEAYSSFSTVGSDHRIVTARVQLSLRAPKRRPNKPRSLNFKALSRDSQLQERYAVEVLNRFNVLVDEHQDLPAQEKYNCLSAACLDAAKEVLPKRPKRNFKSIAQCRSVQEARSRLQNAIDQGDDITQPRQELKEAYLSEEENLLNEKISQIQQASYSNKHSEAWRVINEITGRKERKPAMLAGTPDERTSAWLHHFQNLLGKQPTVPDTNFDITPVVEGILPIEVNEFTLEEVESALNQAKSGGAIGLDNIPLELWKSKQFRSHLLEICNRALIQHEIPSQWSMSAIIPIPKKGDLSQPANYRGISLSCIGAKVYNRMILNRIRPYVDPLLRWNQNGFREKRSTISQILALRRIIEGMKERNLPLAAVFIDFSKAFDSVHRDRMFDILSAYGIPDIIVKAIKVIYDNSSAIVISPDGETEPFKISAGVLQGDTLAPFIFITVLDYIMRYALTDIHDETGILLEPRRSRRYPEIRLHDLDFADDIALLATSISKAECLLQSVEAASNAVGLHLNEGKTKTLLINIPATDSVKTTKGAELENVSEFKYLGAYVPDSFQDFRCRKAQAWTACNKLHKIWKSGLDRTTKIRFFRACVESILLYGSETWTISKKMEDRINGCYTRLLRRVFNISWRDHIPNSVVYGDIPPVTSTIRQRRLRFAGHCMRTANQPISRLIFWTPPGGKANRGRRPLQYPDTIKNDIGLDLPEIQQLMNDKGVWVQYVANAFSIPPTDDL